MDDTTKQEPVPKRKMKTKIQRPKILEEIFHQTRQKRSVYYFTHGRTIKESKCKSERNPFQLPKVEGVLKMRALEKELREEWRSLDRKKKVYDKHTYRSRQKADMSERLYVPPSEEEKRAPTAGIVDIDKQFFTIVKGRPMEESKLELRKYVHNVRDALLSRLKTGFLYDDIYLMDHQRDVEEKTLAEIRQKLQEYSNSFDEFLAKDNDRSMTLLREASEESAKTSEKKEELKVQVEEFIKLKCEMYSLEEIWSKGKLCKDFLYEISPPSWRKKWEKENRSKKKERKKEEEEMKLSDSLENLLDPFLQDRSENRNPPLYFSQPIQMRHIFRDLELQNQNALLHLEALIMPNRMAVACLEATKNYYKKEITTIDENLRGFEKLILAEEEKAKNLKEKATKLVNTLFKDIVSNENTVLLHAHIQNVYEACINSDGSKLKPLDMLRDIENEYKRLLLELDTLPMECVTEAKKRVKENTEFVLGEARDARKKINYIDILLRRAAQAMDPPVKKKTRPLVFRSEPPPFLFKPPPPIKELTAEELEYVHYFTDKTEQDPNVGLYFPLGY